MEPVTVVVPVLRRPQRAEPFMASLRESLPEGGAEPPVIALANADDRDTALAWRRTGARVVLEHHQPGSFGQKANHAVPYVHTPWMFLTGDDVCFHPGWLEAAFDGIDDQVGVIGTNDLGNPAVQAGEHATHMLLRMRYVREQGASWNGPETVAGPYRHWFTDNEIVAVAKLRGAWAMRLGSVVEHLHPYFDRGTMDDVYRIGEEHAQADQQLWLERLARFAPHLLAPPDPPPTKLSTAVVDLTGGSS